MVALISSRVQFLVAILAAPMVDCLAIAIQSNVLEAGTNGSARDVMMSWRNAEEKDVTAKKSSAKASAAKESATSPAEEKAQAEQEKSDKDTSDISAKYEQLKTELQEASKGREYDYVQGGYKGMEHPGFLETSHGFLV